MTPKSNFMSVFASGGGYRGCVVRTAKGWLAYDHLDKSIGTFGTQHEAAECILSLAST
jgi:hypothetical protein